MKSLFTKNDCRALFSMNNPKHSALVVCFRVKIKRIVHLKN